MYVIYALLFLLMYVIYALLFLLMYVIIHVLLVICPFCFLLIEFHCGFLISYKVLVCYAYYYWYLIRF